MAQGMGQSQECTLTWEYTLCQYVIILFCSPKTGPALVLVLWDDKIEEKGASSYEVSQFTAEQVAMAMRQAESGTPVPEVCRKMEISEQTFYRWKRKYAGIGVAEVRRLKVVKEENRKLKQLAAVLSPGRQMLQDVLRKNPEACANRGNRPGYSKWVQRERVEGMRGVGIP